MKFACVNFNRVTTFSRYGYVVVNSRNAGFSPFGVGENTEMQLGDLVAADNRHEAAGIIAAAREKGWVGDYYISLNGVLLRRESDPPQEEGLLKNTF